MLTIILEDYGLGEMYDEGFEKLNQFMRMIEKGIVKFIPKLTRFFRDEGSLVELVVIQWIITLFTMDFSIELAF